MNENNFNQQPNKGNTTGVNLNPNEPYNPNVNLNQNEPYNPNVNLNPNEPYNPNVNLNQSESYNPGVNLNQSEPYNPGVNLNQSEPYNPNNNQLYGQNTMAYNQVNNNISELGTNQKVDLTPNSPIDVQVSPVKPLEQEVRRENTSRHKVENIEYDEPKPKKKSHKGLIVFLILIILGLGGYIAYDKYLYKYINPKEVEKDTTKETKDTTTEEKEQTSIIADKNEYFISADKKYTLTLVKEVNNLKNFILVLNDEQGNHYITGQYSILNEQLTLNISTGCIDQEGKLTCTLPTGVENVVGTDKTNTITLSYSNDKIMLGNVELLKN